MAYRDRRRLNKVLLITIISIIVFITLTIIITNVVISNWGFYEIFSTIGGALMIVGGFGIYTTFAGSYAVSNPTLHGLYPELAAVEMRYARKRRVTFPIISFLLFGLGVISLAVGLSGAL